MHISLGVVKVNNKVMTELGYQVKEGDVVHFDGKRITPEKKAYVLLNKPKGFITTTKDEKGRKTVMDLIAKSTPSRVVPVGRLDRPTTGLLLFTNDGDLAKKLTHPSSMVKKLYHVVRYQIGPDLIKERFFNAKRRMSLSANLASCFPNQNFK